MYVNRKVADILEITDDILKRTEEFENYGLWNVAGYFASDEPYSAEMAAVIYKALMPGEGVSHELSAINTWKASDDNGSIDAVRRSLSRFVHPRFIYCTTEIADQDNDQQETYVDATSGVSGKELALHMGLPRASAPGIAASE